ncbi:putative plastid transcriptionally active 5 [Klebsormidium nitens]|uniref:Putative plastid transcriptionally active 5 n=1 Tax=Klebsormidium nitens TaxID=105231 RepID=A0A1Y1IJE6_KLENI|nr:putative plastid transcriptionally active 5 [Klebsormidium nitens]|eukprot:GAQ89231.1 putative plastid transcriptionally active 5 [Klebsormidium nitens]
MASSGALLVAAPVSRITCSSMSIIRRPAFCLSQPCTPMATHPRPRNPIHNSGFFSNPASTSTPSLLIAAGGKKDKLKKRRKGRRDSTVHKALGPGGESVLTVTSRLSPEEVWEREERRWEREELRWLREEQRWLKEESRWEREREEWAQEEAQLQNHIEALRASFAETQLEAQSRADAMRLSIQEESAQAQMVGEAALGAQLAIDGELQLARARWREEEQALLAEVDALKTALAEVLDEANAKAEAARMTWQKHEATLQAEIAQLKHSLLEAQAVAQARNGGKSAKPTKPASEKAPKMEKPETIVRPAPTAEEIIAAVASRTPTPMKPEVKGVFKTSFSNGAAATNGAPKTAPPAAHRTLRYGAEGPDVKAVQAELERLGFYCGEEEMEADAYEDGTDTAVKSWQCSVGVREDGVLTPELQVLLLGGVVAGAKQGGAAVTEARVEQKDREVESERFARTAAEGSVSGSTRRVYLLGENRWEEPDRLVPNSAKAMAVGMQKCFACKGEGKVMCTECEGTGDMNVEEQFLSWAGEDPSCPYCNGTGATDCDSCQGSGIEKILIS